MNADKNHVTKTAPASGGQLHRTDRWKSGDVTIAVVSLLRPTIQQNDTAQMTLTRLALLSMPVVYRPLWTARKVQKNAAFNRTRQKQQIFGVIPFVELQNNT